MDTKKIDVRLLLACLGLEILVLGYAVLANRALTFDLSYWLVGGVLAAYRPVYDHDLFRQFDAVLQLPTVGLAALAGSHDWTRAILLTWNLAYCFQPIASLALCWWICARARTPNAFLFPVMSFAAATLPTLPAPGSIVPTSLAVFWPLLLCFLLEKPGAWRTAGIWLGSLCLAFTHESAFVLFLVLLVAAGKARPISFLFLAGAAWLAWRGVTANHTTYTNSMITHWGPHLWMGAAAALSFTAVLEWSQRSGRLPPTAIWALALGTASVFVIAALISPTIPPANAGYHARVPAVPIAAMIAIACIRHVGAKARPWRLLSRFTVAVLVLGTLLDLRATRSWSLGLDHMRAALRSPGPSCLMIEDRDFRENFSPYGISPSFLPAISILVQNTRQPERILGARAYSKDVLQIDFCHDVSEGKAWVFPGIGISLGQRGYFDYRKLRLPAGPLQRPDAVSIPSMR